jgi:chemotaxis family two-component system response regulator PixG
MNTTNPPNRNTACLSQQLEQCAQQGLTGKLDVSAGEQRWTIFFCLGRLVWATGGQHPNRSFRRIWQQTCSQIQPIPKSDRAAVKQQSPGICPHYDLFRTLVKQEQLPPETIKAVVRHRCQEVFFDLLQQETFNTLAYQQSPEGGLETVSTLMSGLLWPRQVFPEAYQEWMDWQAAGLQDISPHEVPTIAQPEKLQQMTATTTYKILQKAIDGRRSLRDLAVATGKEPWRLGRSMLPYLRQGAIALTQLPDCSSPNRSPRISPPTHQGPSMPSYVPASQSAFRVACIDDSPYIQRQMQDIATQAGWEFVEIQDSIRVLPYLLETLPHLIFLDLVMPIANGYELCAQMRRVSALKSIPVVIVTNQNRTMDRMRARFVGANDFLTKPIQPAQVLAIAQKYLQAQP